MITYKKIGHFGRLGNQMFQFASTYGVAKKLGYEVAFPIENASNPNVEDFKDGVTRKVYFDIPRIFEIDQSLLKSAKDIYTEYEVQEPHFHFCSDLFKIPDSCNFSGYYQTEKYFDHCEEDIRRLFTFKKDIINQAKNKFPDLEYEKVAIHLRIGDYAALQNFHPVCEPEYYNRAIKNFLDKNYYFLVFSDDIAHCKNIFGESDNIFYIEDNTPEIDLCIMSMCDHNIIANSSFSWWAAWLNQNKNKKVIAPKKWFGPAYESIHDTKDLYPNTWILE